MTERSHERPGGAPSKEAGGDSDPTARRRLPGLDGARVPRRGARRPARTSSPGVGPRLNVSRPAVRPPACWWRGEPLLAEVASDRHRLRPCRSAAGHAPVLRGSAPRRWTSARCSHRRAGVRYRFRRDARIAVTVRRRGGRRGPLARRDGSGPLTRRRDGAHRDAHPDLRQPGRRSGSCGGRGRPCSRGPDRRGTMTMRTAGAHAALSARSSS